MVRHDARAVVLILDKAMGDTGGVNADYAHLDGIEDVRNHMNNFKEKKAWECSYKARHCYWS